MMTPEEIKKSKSESCKKWRKKNADRISEYGRKWRAQHPDKMAKYLFTQAMKLANTKPVAPDESGQVGQKAQEGKE